MNAKKFEAFQRAADIELLEEAQTAPKRSGGWQKFVLTAACLCVVASAASVWQPWNTSSKKTGDQSQLPDPWSDTTIENIRAMGFDMVLPDGAEDITFTALNAGENGADMVEADYTLGGIEYTCRAAKRSTSYESPATTGRKAMRIARRTAKFAFQPIAAKKSMLTAITRNR